MIFQYLDDDVVGVDDEDDNDELLLEDLHELPIVSDFTVLVVEVAPGVLEEDIVEFASLGSSVDDV
jgi:hypothetical protein